MRFLLDNDVDVAVGRVLRSAGHECWTAAEANLAGRVAADDDKLSCTRKTSKRSSSLTTASSRSDDFAIPSASTSGSGCEQPDAAELVAENLDELETALTQHPEVVVIVSTDGVEARPPSWE